MLSNKLTFSLASLIVLLIIGLCMPVAAQRLDKTTVITLPTPSADGIVGASIPGYTFVVFGIGTDAASGGLDLPAQNMIKDVSHTATKGMYINAASTFETASNGRTDGNMTLHPSPNGKALDPTDPVIQLDVDLEEFFRLGGTIELIAPADGDDEFYVNDPIANLGLGKHDLVISEVMWALDLDAADVASKNDRRQWIEIYNTMADPTGSIVNITGDFATGYPIGNTGRLKLRFVPYYHLERPGDMIPAAAGITANGGPVGEAAGANPAVIHRILDSVSNLQFVRWEVHGENGNTTPPRGTFGQDPPLKTIVSMYRNLDYRHIAAMHALVDNRKEQLKGVPNGALPESWKATPVLGRRNIDPTITAVGTDVTVPDSYIAATPAAEHVQDVVYTGVTKTTIPSNSVVINEVRNDTSASNIDWVELYNAGTEPVDLHGWELSLIDGSIDVVKTPADGKKLDTMLVGLEDGGAVEDRFPAGANWKLEAGEYLLIVNRHPRETVLANGVNIDEVVEGREVKAGAMHQYIVREKLNLPNAAITLLLRNAVDKNSHHAGDNIKWQTALAPSETIMDYAGTVSIEVKTNAYNTLVWPFRGWTKAVATDGLDGEGIPNNPTNALARLRYQADDGHHKDAWDNVTAKGGLGYDRGVDLKYAPGTPGYANDSIRGALVDDKSTRVTTDDVIYNGEVAISEVMYDAGPRWHLIQWIELYNSSVDETINLKDWRMEIFNASDEVESYVDSGFVFNDAYILPNQTLLIVSGSGTNDVSPNRVYSLYQYHRRDLGLTNRRSVLLSPDGFYLRLTDKNDDPVDEAGNVEVKGSTRAIMWELPDRNPEYRQSLVRQYGSRELYDGTPDAADDGTMMESWVQSDLIDAGIAFYGHRDDVGTPGYRLGGPLPVSLVEVPSPPQPRHRSCRYSMDHRV